MGRAEHKAPLSVECTIVSNRESCVMWKSAKDCRKGFLYQF